MGVAICSRSMCIDTSPSLDLISLAFAAAERLAGLADTVAGIAHAVRGQKNFGKIT